jgi:cyclic pyranopterin monophosphate synthase
VPARKLSHVRADGSVTMVDVAAKRATHRRAVAEAVVRMSTRARRLLDAGLLKKGDALAAAQLAGIMAVKRTPELIPLCHPLQIDAIDVRFAMRPRDVRVTCTVSCTGPTGVEMEAMTGAAVAALTIYDMCKAADRGITIGSLRLLEKSGGKSGVYRR